MKFSTVLVLAAKTVMCCLLSLQSQVAVVDQTPRPGGRVVERSEIRLGLPSKGRMVDDTLALLKNCRLSVVRDNPRQYIAAIPEFSNLKVWFQRPNDIVRKLVHGDLDLGIVGLGTVSEYGQGNEDLIIVHDTLDYGICRLSLAIPKCGMFENINSVRDLAQMPQWTEDRPLVVATGFTYLGSRFMKDNGLKHVSFLTADGAMEANPGMGTADAILDLVCSGTTLRENNLKEIEGGVVLESQAVLVASRKSLIEREGALDITHKLLERLEAHLCAAGKVKVTAIVGGSSVEEVAQRVLGQPLLSGRQGLTITQVFCERDGAVVTCYAVDACVPEKEQFEFVQQLRAIGVSEVQTSKLSSIFKEETPKWRELLLKLGR